LGAGLAGEAGEEDEVLGSGEHLVDAGVLAGQADELADLVGLGCHVVAGNGGAAFVGGDEGGEDVDGGGLAGAVRAEEAEDGALFDVQVDSVDGGYRAEALG
jgi:hypothetical protein